MTAQELCYSINEENFDHDDMEDAVEMAWQDHEPPYPYRTIIWEGTKVKRTAADYTMSAGFLVEDMQERAGEALGEISMDWLTDITQEQLEALGTLLSLTVNRWASEYDMQPNFYGVEAVKEIVVEFREPTEGSEHLYNYKVINDAQTILSTQGTE